MPFIKIERLTNSLKVIGEELEDYIENEINNAITALEDKVEDLECKVSELEDVVEENYRHSIELAQDCADEVKSELENRLDDLEKVSDE